MIARWQVVTEFLGNTNQQLDKETLYYISDARDSKAAAVSSVFCVLVTLETVGLVWMHCGNPDIC